MSVLTFAVSKGNEMGTLGTGLRLCSRDGESLVYMDYHRHANPSHSATGYASIDNNIAHILLPLIHMLPSNSGSGGTPRITRLMSCMVFLSFIASGHDMLFPQD